MIAHSPSGRAVVGVLDVDLIAEELVIVLEYVRGTSLKDLFRAVAREGKRLPVSVASRVICDVLGGLHAAHELSGADGAPLGLVHRDVSPHNVLIGADGRTKVTDFGVAHARGRLAATRADNVVKGKLGYLAPEQLNRKSIDRRADVFAAGIVLWEALTGESLFAGGTEAETVGLVLRRPIPPPSTLAPEVTLELDEVCLRALERDPERRFATALDFERALAMASPLAPYEEVGALVQRLAAEALARHDEALRAPAPETRTAMAVDAPRERGSGRSLAIALASLVIGAGAVWGVGAWRASPTPPPSAPSTTAEPSPAQTASTAASPSGESRSGEPPAAASPPPLSFEIIEAPPRVVDAGARRDLPGKPGRKTAPRGSGQFMPSDL
jgi:serine/threonine-protein kinase